MTRAKEKLYLSRVQFRRRYGKSEMAVASRFLDEIPDKALDVQDRTRPAFLADAGNFPRVRGMGFQPMGRNHGLEAHATEGEKDEAFAKFEKEIGEGPGDEAPSRLHSTPASRRDPALAAAVDRLLDTSDTQLESGDFEIGDRVRHPHFGLGVIEALTGAGLSRKVKVHFRQHGPKLLLLNLAKLVRI
jgi:DNA helicase-2/ATP-dependent DNA helicase PcrA